MEEIWKEVEGYNGKYEISNLGRIKSYAQNPSGKIKNGYVDAKGYVCIRLYDEKKVGHWYKMHRLVASTFIENPDNLSQVNHKDEDKTNNCTDNLEWCDCNYNVNYGTKIQRTADKNRCNPAISKTICSLDDKGNITHYGSINDAERKTGLSHSNIIRTLKGRTKKCGGYQWYYNN